MANTLGNPTLDTTLREALAVAVNAALNTGGGANAVLRLLNTTGPVTLVNFNLDATNPVTAGGSDGSVTVNPQASGAATAVGGSATLPNQYQILDKAGTVRMTGNVTATDAITTGQTVTLGTTTITMPAS